MAANPKPTRKKVITNTVRTPSGAKTPVQSNKDVAKNKWVPTKGVSYSRTDKPSYDNKGKLVNEALNINKDLKGTKKL